MKWLSEWPSPANLSLRYKIPARATALMLVTAIALTSAIVTRVYDELRQDLFNNAEILGGVLSETLVEPMRNDDVWRAYEIIRAPLVAGDNGADKLLLVDDRQRIFVSSQPGETRMLASLEEAGASPTPVAQAIEDMFSRPQTSDATPPAPRRLVGEEHYFMLQPVMADGVMMGTLILRYPRDIHWPRFVGMVERAATVTLLVLLALLPLSWWWGRRMARPLTTLADCMKRVGDRIPEEPECRLQESNDEIGQLSRRLREMLAELRQKELLEQQVMASERLAAVGRLTGGIAHEINNPLGGMLNAISTQKRHGDTDARTARTLDLLERGLLQIRDTVSALLVEARPERQPLAPTDLQDVRTLIQPNIQRRKARLDWHDGLRETIPLPAALVRQILINLLLNATQAVENGGRVECRIRYDGDVLNLQVGNTGQHIPEDRLARLFEPDAPPGAEPREAAAGRGIGLWMTWQITTQLKGTIDVDSRPGWTEFRVRLPRAEALEPALPPTDNRSERS
ncbi:HAMP domain-containing sensor histidine kinase [Thioalkalivibrio sp. AKL17]|uniref:sensor histidine kinase n=1 Tax=Thioalkalivibrio sp. AKL17 TaxID=1158160 RepID=UPI00035CB554|nr:HAMP domain-containing sensor histidine kinase [Thioalkalivibrio sp. AKL17]